MMTVNNVGPLRLLVGKVLPSLHWRHHAAGMLQAYIEPHLRVHIWHDDLVVHEDGIVHDHRRTLKSTVLTGGVVNTTYWESDVRPDALHNQWLTYECVGASKGSVQLVKQAPVAMHSGSVTPCRFGGTYTVEQYGVHMARNLKGAFTVTLVELGDEGSRWARMFMPVSDMTDRLIPRGAFQHEPSTRINEFVDAAKTALLEAA